MKCWISGARRAAGRVSRGTPVGSDAYAELLQAMQIDRLQAARAVAIILVNVRKARVGVSLSSLGRPWLGAVVRCRN